MVKGEVTIVKRDAVTDEVKETIVQENTTTYLFPYSIIRHWADSSNIGLDTVNIAIGTTQRSTKEISAKAYFPPEVLVTDNASKTKYPNGSPAPYWEFNARLSDNPGNYTFYHVMLRAGREDYTIAYIFLDPPCVQAPGENIDITYRLYFYDEALSDDFSLGYPIKNYWKHAFNTNRISPEGVDFSTNIANIANYTNTLETSMSAKVPDGLTRRYETFWNSGADLGNPPASSNTSYNYFNISGNEGTGFGKLRQETFTSTDTDFSFDRRSAQVNIARNSERNGQVFASLRSGINMIPFLPANNYIYDTINYNSPIQIIHNHSKNAIRPASDVDYLAGSAGRPNANGVNWTNPDFPKHYRVEVSGTGDTGSSVYYNWAVEDFHLYHHDTDTNNELYWHGNGELISMPWLSGIFTMQDADYQPGSGNDTAGIRQIKAVDFTSATSGFGMHGVTNPRLFNRFRHDSSLAKTHIMTHDFDGITLLQVHKGWFWNFDSARTNMNFSYLTQLTTDANNNIWCCDRVQGLIRISDITGSPTANVMSVSTNSIQTGNCYGVCFTGNNRIYAMFEGGLVYSDNPTLNDSNSITFTNSTFTARSGERSNITGLIGDPEHTDHHLAVMFANTTVSDITQDIFWYTGSTQSTVKSTEQLSINETFVRDRLKITDALVLSQKYYNTLLHCTDKGSIWIKDFFIDENNIDVFTTYPVFFNDQPYYPSWPSTTNGFGRSLNNAFGSSPIVNKTDSALNRNDVPYISGTLTGEVSLQRRTFHTFEATIEDETNQEATSDANETSNIFNYIGVSTIFPNSSAMCLTHDASYNRLRNSTPYAGYFNTGISRRGMENYNTDDTTLKYGGELSNPTSWDGRSPMGRQVRWRRYGWNGSAWVEGYGQPFNDTAALTGSKNSAVDLKRIGFDWNTAIFAGDAYCDGTELFDGSSYTWSTSPDATFAFSLDARDKQYNAQTGQCIFDYHEPYTDNRISLWLNFKNRYSQSADTLFEDRSSENIVLIGNATGNTVFADLGSASAYLNSENDQFSANNRFVVTVDNTSANLYINGTQIGGVTLTNAVDWRNQSGNAKFYIGVDAISDVNGKSLPLHFLNGRMTNFAVHDSKWSISDIENDNTTPGSISGNKAAEWLMTESLQDGRQTHTNEETIEDGIKVAWPSYTPSPSDSWEDGDFWTFVVSEGIFKDNTNEFDWTNYEYIHPVDYNFTQVTNTGARTDRVMFSMRDEMINPTSENDENFQSFSPSNLGHVFSDSNEIVRWYSLPASGGTNFTLSGFIELANTQNTSLFRNGMFVSDTPTLQDQMYARTEAKYGVYVSSHPTTASSRDVAVYEGASNPFTEDSSNWKIGDKFQIQKTGTTITYSRNGSVFYTSLTSTSSNPYYIGITAQTGGWSNVEFTYTPPSDVKFIGDNSSKTGYQHKDFFRIHTEDAPAIRNVTDATDYEVLLSNDFYKDKTAPSTNQVVLDDVGYFVVPTGEVGDTFSANVVLGYTNHPGPNY